MKKTYVKMAHSVRELLQLIWRKAHRIVHNIIVGWCCGALINIL